MKFCCFEALVTEYSLFLRKILKCEVFNEVKS